MGYLTNPIGYAGKYFTYPALDNYGESLLRALVLTDFPSFQVRMSMARHQRQEP